MEPENELEKHLKALKIRELTAVAFRHRFQRVKKIHTYITLHYKLGDERNSMKIYASQEYFYRDLIRQLSNS